jgi:hypothetical protein
MQFSFSDLFFSGAFPFINETTFMGQPKTDIFLVGYYKTLH